MIGSVVVTLGWGVGVSDCDKVVFLEVGYTQRVAHEREVSCECYQWSVLFPPCITKSEMIGMVVVAQLTLLTRRFVLFLVD